MSIFQNNFLNIILKRYNDLNDDEKNLIVNFYNKNGFKKIKTLVETKKIEPFASKIFCELNLDYVYWKNIQLTYKKRNNDIKDILNSLFKKTELLDCKSLVLIENFAVLLSTGECISQFCSSDVDLYVNFNELKLVTKSLTDLGFCEKKQSKNINKESNQFIQFYNKDLFNFEFWVNISWKPITRKFLIQDKYEDRIKNNITSYKIVKKTSIKVFDNDALLYFNALHISCGHFYLFSPGRRLYIDIDRTIRMLPVNFNNIFNWENSDDAGIRISLTLVICNKFLSTPIPNIFIEKIENNLINKILSRHLLGHLFSIKENYVNRLIIEFFSNNNLNFLKLRNLFKVIKS
jgi:hypothetical protein